MSPSSSSSFRRALRCLVATLVAGVSYGTSVTQVSAKSPAVVWNSAVLEAVRTECTSATLASRNLAVLHLALEKAVQEAPEEPAVEILTGGLVANALFPTDAATFDRVQQALLADLPAGHRVAASKRAQEIAQAILAEREGDGSSRSVTYIPRAEPGQWRRTAPHFRPPESPNWASVKPFSIANPEAHLPPGPPALDSDKWKAAAAELRDVGGRNAAKRSDFQKASAVFWSDFSYTCTPPGHWNEIAADVVGRGHYTELQTARLFAALNVAMADAGIVCWRAKFRYNAWRPITALEGESWKPLLVTPPHPEYPSGHSSFSAAAAAVLTAFVGSDSCTFSVPSDAARGVWKTYTSFAEAAREISDSRIYGGIHFRFSCEDGLALGRSVAAEVLRQRQVHAGSPSPFAGLVSR